MTVQTAKIIESQSRSPSFWPHDVVFFANLLGLFFGNEEGTDCLAREIGEIDSYGGRLVPILNLLFSGGDNLLILENKPDAALCAYFQNVLGLRLPAIEVMSHATYKRMADLSESGRHDELEYPFDIAARHPSRWIDGYVTDEALLEISRLLGKQTISTTAGSRQGNNKLLLHEHLRDQGLPTLDTEIARDPQDVRRCAKALAQKGYHSVAVKAQIGASGIGILRLDDVHRNTTTPEIPGHLFFEGPCLVQGWVQPGHMGVTGVHSPSVQMFLDHERLCLYDTTEQILDDGGVHEGNISPIPYLPDHPGLKDELMRQAAVAGQWLHERGYRGTASADFLVIHREQDPSPEVHVCEINARVTGATYPAVLARSFRPRGAWLMHNLRLAQPTTGEALLDVLEKSGHLFRPDTPSGVLPINFNHGADGLVHKGQFLFLAPTVAGCRAYLERAEITLPVEWTVDRD